MRFPNKLTCWAGLVHLVLLVSGGQKDVLVVELLREELVELVEAGLYRRLAHVGSLAHVLEEVAPAEDVKRCQDLNRKRTECKQRRLNAPIEYRIPSALYAPGASGFRAKTGIPDNHDTAVQICNTPWGTAEVLSASDTRRPRKKDGEHRMARVRFSGQSRFRRYLLRYSSTS